MIKNLTQQNKLLICLLSKGYQPSFNLSLNNQLNLNLAQIKCPLGLINKVSYNFAYDNKKKPPRSGQRNYKSGQFNNKSGQKVQYKKFEQMRPSQKQLREKQAQQQRYFTTQVTNPQLFIDHINNKNRIEDAVKLLNRILNTRSLTKDEFQTNVWKKYSYYVYLIGEKQELRWNKQNGIQSNVQGLDNKLKGQFQEEAQQKEQKYQQEKQLFQQQQQTDNISKTQPESNELPDNHKIARMTKAKKLRLQFLSQITQIHLRFKAQLHSQNVTKTFNKFTDFYFQNQQWSTLTFAEKISLIQSLSRYNIKKAKTLFLKKRPSLFIQPKKLLSQNKEFLKEETNFSGADLIKVLDLMNRLQINDTQLFEKCIDLLYEEIDRMNLLLLEEVTYLLGKSHKFVNKDFLLRVRNRFNQLINQFDDTSMLRALHILSSLSMIEKNMHLNAIYFEPLDLVYERMFPVFDGQLMKRMKSKYLATIASTLRRAQYFGESVLNSLIMECMERDVLQFSLDESQLRTKQVYKQELRMINIGQLSQVFFCLASFNYRVAQFMKYFLNILKIVQSSVDAEKYISYPLFSRLLWSMCVLCNEREIEELVPLLQHFYKSTRQVEPHEATNYYYCYLLLKRKYMLSDIRFQNDKIQQYLSGPKHQVQTSQIQKQVHQHLLQIGIPSLLQYNLNNLICDIYIPKFHSLQHLIIEIHGFHHFPRNIKRLNGATVLKQKIIENQGYTCFYISLDQWLIAQDKSQFLKDFFSHILHKKNQEKKNSKLLQDSLKSTQNLQKRGRRILEFKRKPQKQTQQIGKSQQQEEIRQIPNKRDN